MNRTPHIDGRRSANKESSVQSALITEGRDEGARALLDKEIAPGLPQPFYYVRKDRMGNQTLSFVWIFELLIL